MYPFLAHLLDTDAIRDGDLRHEAVNKLRVTAGRAYFTRGWDEMARAFEQSSLWLSDTRGMILFNILTKGVSDNKPMSRILGSPYIFAEDTGHCNIHQTTDINQSSIQPKLLDSLISDI